MKAIILILCILIDKPMYLTIKIYRNGKEKVKTVWCYSPVCLKKRSIVDGTKRVLFERVDSFKVISKSYKK